MINVLIVVLAFETVLLCLLCVLGDRQHDELAQVRLELARARKLAGDREEYINELYARTVQLAQVNRSLCNDFDSMAARHLQLFEERRNRLEIVAPRAR